MNAAAIKAYGEGGPSGKCEIMDMGGLIVATVEAMPQRPPTMITG